jgi:hypothetical protein
LKKFTHTDMLENLIRLFRELMENQFYGELVVKFEAENYDL